ncbi:MAG: hypothetical protein F6J87_17890 [Spirulina sp. SIO3F2]|nr:hypothetical protein [Spirulina sp. SIO3F2]
MPLPFLQSICWQITAVEKLTPQQMLDCYERGWRYRKLFGNLEAAEQQWIKTLAETFDSWLLVEL